MALAKLVAVEARNSSLVRDGPGESAADADTGSARDTGERAFVAVVHALARSAKGRESPAAPDDQCRGGMANAYIARWN